MINKQKQKNKRELAPVLLVAFNRPDHFAKTLEALSKNTIAKNTILYISIDGPVTKKDRISQSLISNFIKLNSTNFFKIISIENKNNKGLSANIIDSVSYVLTKHKKIIVLEDDLISSRKFLEYTNDALDFYEDKKKIWHINGHNIISKEKKKNDIFLWRFMNCWGWATWRDRWQYFDKNPLYLLKTFNKNMIYRFNLDGATNFWEQVKLNANGELNTWAIFWYATIFTNNGICVSPWFSYISNIGFDGSGTNCELKIIKLQKLNHYGKFIGKNNYIEDDDAFRIMKSVYKRSLIKKVIYGFLKIILGKNIYQYLKKIFGTLIYKLTKNFIQK